MSGYRKLGRTSSQRKALLRSQVTQLLYHGRIITTESKAKEVMKIADGLIALAVKEKDDFQTVTVTAKVPRKDAEGKRVKEVVDGKKRTVYDEVQKEIKKDNPARLHARRQMLKVLYPVTEVPKEAAGRRSFLRRSLRSISAATVVIPASSRSGSAAVTEQWRSFWSLSEAF